VSAPSRRDVLACLACACALACVGEVPAGGDDTAGDTGDGTDTEVDPRAVDGGTVDLYQVGDLVPVGGGAAVGRDVGGLYAISTVCTHRGCDMAARGVVSGDGLECDCHGSEFEVDGTVRRGPAVRRLPFYALAIDDGGRITVDTEQEVDSDTRVAPSLG
jgi:Rieske Fe-S protein